MTRNEPNIISKRSVPHGNARSKSRIFKMRGETSSNVGANDHSEDSTWKGDVDKSFSVNTAGQTSADQNTFYSI